ncbi:ABC transporter permease [candidate division KSB1 bacterium]|nr:ABC transporter permease [candidate division KSB1 bacterium]
MFINYLKIALRNIRLQKGYSFINIFGFSIGLTSCLLILLYVAQELSYDRFHSKADRIYRVTFSGNSDRGKLFSVYTGAPLAAGFRQEFPEIESITRMMRVGEQVVRYGESTFNEKNILRADPSFFSVFDFQVLEGDPATALADPGTVLLTETTAKRYFGTTSTIGQILLMDDEGTPYKVTGIVKDVPANSHFDFDMLISMTGHARAASTNWLNIFLFTYLVLEEGASATELEAKFPLLYDKYFTPLLQSFMKISWQEFKEQGNDCFFGLQPLTKIHLHSHTDGELKANGNLTNLCIFSLIALFILLIACINYMNLSTARSAKRGKEVGVRKVLGAGRKNLIRQFLTESMLFSFLAMFIAIALIQLFIPIFNNISGTQLSSSLFQNGWTVGLLVLTLLIGLFSGSYPAFYLTIFKPIQILSGVNKLGAGSKLRSGLVVFQFAISIGLVLATVIVYKQLQFIREKNLGFDRENVLIIPNANRLGSQKESFRQALRGLADVINASASEAIPARGGYNGTIFRATAPASDEHPFEITDADQQCRHFETDTDYLQTMGIDLIAGRNFSTDMSTDQSAVIINEATAGVFGWDDPVGKCVYGTGMKDSPEFQVIGVVRDYHFNSLHELITPVIMMRGGGGIIIVRIQGGHINETIQAIENTWKEFAPNMPFVYSFLDQEFDALFRAEQQFGKLVAYFAMLTIFIACLGAFGLATFSAEQRTKEIGIRKSLGASVQQVVFMLTKEFTRLVVVAFVIVVPIAWYVMSRWLQNFAYRTSISVGIILLAGLTAILFAWLTVSYQAVRAATANPVKALRYE